MEKQSQKTSNENYEIQGNSAEKQFNFTIVDNEIIFDKQLDVYDLKLLLFLKAVSIQKSESFYSLSKMVEFTGIGKDRIIKSIKRLEDLKYIQKKQNKTNKSFNNNVYVLLPKEKRTFNELVGITDKGVVDNNDKGSRSDRQGVVVNTDTNNINNNNINNNNINNTTSNEVDTSELLNWQKIYYNLFGNTSYEITSENYREFFNELAEAEENKNDLQIDYITFNKFLFFIFHKLLKFDKRFNNIFQIIKKDRLLEIEKEYWDQLKQSPMLFLSYFSQQFASDVEIQNIYQYKNFLVKVYEQSLTEYFIF